MHPGEHPYASPSKTSATYGGRRRGTVGDVAQSEHRSVTPAHGIVKMRRNPSRVATCFVCRMCPEQVANSSGADHSSHGVGQVWRDRVGLRVSHDLRLDDGLPSKRYYPIACILVAHYQGVLAGASRTRQFSDDGKGSGRRISYDDGLVRSLKHAAFCEQWRLRLPEPSRLECCLSAVETVQPRGLVRRRRMCSGSANGTKDGCASATESITTRPRPHLSTRRGDRDKRDLHFV